MPDLVAEVLALPGLGWLVLATLVAGTVRGFAGFGTALVYMPVAAQVLDPFWAILTVMIMDIFGPLPNLPSALRTADRGDLARLWAGTVLALPLGLLLLARVDPEVFRIGVGALALVLVAALALGLRRPSRAGPGLVFATGGLAGFLGGVSGMPGPPVILLYVSGPGPSRVVRASTMAYLFGYDCLLAALLALKGVLAALPVGVGLLLAVPNLAGNLIGAALYRPGHERGYRAAAHVIIAASALSALGFGD